MPVPLKILITNIRLDLRSGTEIVVRDFALRLSERQHEVTVYTPTIGGLAEELTSRGIPVVDNLLNVPYVPDVIHGHHTPSTAAAILAFPNTPAIWVCHDAKSWFDLPPRFSQVRRLFAVDETCKARLVESDGIPAGQIEILPNAVDLRCFQLRPFPPAAAPRRALSLVKHSGPETLIAEACRQTELQFEAYGHGVAKPIDDVWRRCAAADIVFATARTALEAMATGAAVVLVDGRGFGGLVTTANFDLGRRLNFGLGMLKEQPTLAMLTDAIRAYNARDTAAVSQRIRQEADLDRMILQLEDIYISVIRETAGHCFDPDVLRREQIEFCRSCLVKIEPPGPWLDERNHLLSQNTELSRQLAVAAAQNAEMTNLEGRLSHEIDKSARLQEQLSERDVTIQALTLHIDRSERARSVRLARALRRLLGWKAN